MTLSALEVRVFAFEFVASRIVIKRLGINRNRVKITAFMVRVTGDTSFCSHAVKANFVIHKFFDVLMAVQTLRVGDTAAGDVTLQTA